MLGEMHVRIDKAREKETAATVDHSRHGPGRPHIGGAAHLHDAPAVHEHGAVQENPARGIHGDDDGVLDEDHGTPSGRV